MVLSRFEPDDFPGGFLGMFSGVSAGFLGLACIKTLLEMRQLCVESVKLEDIKRVLDSDVVINKSWNADFISELLCYF